MRERVRFGGGRIAIRSAGGHGGTHILVNLPMDQNVSGMGHDRAVRSFSLQTGKISQMSGGNGSPQVIGVAPGDAAISESLALSSTRQLIDRSPAADATWPATCLWDARQADAVPARQGPPHRREQEKSTRMRVTRLATTAVAVAILMNAAPAGARRPAPTTPTAGGPNGTIGAFLTKDIHLSQTLNGPMLTLGIPF